VINYLKSGMFLFFICILLQRGWTATCLVQKTPKIYHSFNDVDCLSDTSNWPGNYPIPSSGSPILCNEPSITIHEDMELDENINLDFGLNQLRFK